MSPTSRGENAAAERDASGQAIALVHVYVNGSPPTVLQKKMDWMKQEKAPVGGKEGSRLACWHYPQLFEPEGRGPDYPEDTLE